MRLGLSISPSYYNDFSASPRYVRGSLSLLPYPHLFSVFLTIFGCVGAYCRVAEPFVCILFSCNRPFPIIAYKKKKKKKGFQRYKVRARSMS
jgi:hypothetical protein